ncbi:GerMN domain-containing protein [Embleya hyalina]|uniref:Lipoprotein n=1 Tax=Embleya hyalina TaxID=516124 RepID=A0A401YEB2_9ACTN|nr:GerMN domain-containing protein [Embleya hyalina]GCD92908.1 lipoprotein [Embleya hyalina]
MKLPATVAAVVVAALVTGCGISTTTPHGVGPPAKGVPQVGTVPDRARLFFASSDGVQAVSRLSDTSLDPGQAIALLLKGPTEAERRQGFRTLLAELAGRVDVDTGEGSVTLTLPLDAGRVEVDAVHQLVCTAANARVPGGRAAGDVDVYFRELGKPDAWGPLHCDVAGYYARPELPAPRASRSDSKPRIGGPTESP